MPEMATAFLEYLRIVANNWLFWFGGVALVVIELLKHTDLKHKFKMEHRKWFWIPAVLCIFWATFDAWDEQHRKALSSGTWLTSDVDVSRAPDPFPIGLTLRMNLHWSNPGQYPAHDCIADGRVYLRPQPGEVRIQEDAINTFKREFAELLDKPPAKEYPTILPNMPSHYWQTYSGPILTKDDVSKIYSGELGIILVSALHFRDGAGLHESHVCTSALGRSRSKSWMARMDRVTEPRGITAGTTLLRWTLSDGVHTFIASAESVDLPRIRSRACPNHHRGPIATRKAFR